MLYLGEPSCIAHYHITNTIKKNFDSITPRNTRSLVVRSLLARHVVRQRAWSLVREKFGFEKESELASRSPSERALIFYEVEMNTRRLVKEMASKNI